MAAGTPPGLPAKSHIFEQHMRKMTPPLHRGHACVFTFHHCLIILISLSKKKKGRLRECPESIAGECSLRQVGIGGGWGRQKWWKPACWKRHDSQQGMWARHLPACLGACNLSEPRQAGCVVRGRGSLSLGLSL